MSRKTPYTKVEVVEERREQQPEDSPLVRISHVLINGKPVTVAQGGIWIDYDHNMTTETSQILKNGIVAVQVTLLVDEFSIRQVPNGYTDGKTSTSTGVHLHFEAGEYITKPGTPVTTKVDQPRDHLGRFTKRKDTE